MASPRLGFGYRRIVSLLVFLVIVPTVLLLSLGIVLMTIGEAQANLLFGILTVAFVAVVVTGVVLVLVFIRRAANLSELQADFVSKVSHELRTPLTGIRLFVETLERAKDDRATQEKCIEQLSKESERLSRLIERLLDWGRMEAGRKMYDLREEPVSGIIEESVAAFGPDRYPDLDFTVEVEENLPLVSADRAALVDAIGNLLSNARKYGGTPPAVRLRARLEGPDAVRIDVRDNGEGIPRGEQNRIFDKFYRIDDRLARMREGSGLGLAIVKHIVRAHGGRIELESEVQKGSTFSILLPAVAPTVLPAST
ncbi:MAG: two-component sensor histidine kinase [Polyangiaceae bacterium]|nr:two-component sensor histidine kinase [Polyangiaceae bacterium]